MIEHAVVIVLFLDQRGAFVLAFNRAMEGVLQPVGVELAPDQIILRASLDEAVARRVVASFDKDFTSLAPRELEARILVRARA